MMSAQLGRWRYWGKKALANGLDDFDMEKVIALSLTPEAGAVLVYEREERQIVGISEPRGTIAAKDAESWVEHHKQYQRLYDFLGEDNGGEIRKKASLSIGSGGSWFA